MTRRQNSMADLRPNATIQCLRCDQHKPQAGSVKFHAHHVCADCAKKLQAGAGPATKS